MYMNTLREGCSDIEEKVKHTTAWTFFAGVFQQASDITEQKYINTARTRIQSHFKFITKLVNFKIINRSVYMIVLTSLP